MFDLGFSELLVIALVALVVLGPQRLPKAARFAGLWVRRARAQWHSVKSEFERELADEELRRTLHDTRAQFEDAAGTLRGQLEDTGRALQREAEGLERQVAGEPPATADRAAPPAEHGLPPERAAAALAPAAAAVERETAEAWTPEEESVPIPEEVLEDRPSISSEPPAELLAAEAARERAASQPAPVAAEPAPPEQPAPQPSAAAPEPQPSVTPTAPAPSPPAHPSHAPSADDHARR